MRKKIKVILGSICFLAVVAASMFAAFRIAKANLEKDFVPTPTPSGQTILTLQYASEKQKEDDVQTTATISFYDNYKCHVEGKIASMYDWSYDSTWSSEGGLNVAAVEKVNAECTDEAGLAFINLIGLATKYDMNVTHTATVTDGGIELTVEGFDAQKGDSLMKNLFVLSKEDAEVLGISGK